MKKIFLFSAIFLFYSICSAQENNNAIIDKSSPSINWSPFYKEATKKSKKENKPILMYFTGSDWCAPCKKLKYELFNSEKFKNIANKNLVMLEIDNPRNKDLVSANKLEENYKLIKKYNVTSYPTFIFINHKGKEIKRKKGLILTEYYYPFIESIIKTYNHI